MHQEAHPEPHGHGAVDPDVDLHVAAQRTELHPTLLIVISIGGMVGASGRYALLQLWPVADGSWPWPTFVTNASGCLLIGLLMAHVESGRAHPLLRPFVGVGVLGGFTTFSTYAVETDALLRTGHAALGLAYLLATLFLSLTGVLVGVLVGRRALPTDPTASEATT